MTDILADTMPLIYLCWGLAAAMVFLVYAWPVASRVKLAIQRAGLLTESDWLRLGIVLVSGANMVIRFFWMPWYLAGMLGMTDLKASVGAMAWVLFFPAMVALGGYCCHLHARFLVSGQKWLAPGVFAACALCIAAWMLAGGSAFISRALLSIAGSL